MTTDLESKKIYRTFGENFWGGGGLKRIVNQDEIVAYVTKYPGKTESQIMENLYDFYRGTSWGGNKKYAECLRRALRSRKISRCLCKPKEGGRALYIYFKHS